MWDKPTRLDLLKRLVSNYSVENNEKVESAEIVRDMGDLTKITMDQDEVEELEAVGDSLMIDEETALDIVVFTDEELLFTD